MHESSRNTGMFILIDLCKCLNVYSLHTFGTNMRIRKMVASIIIPAENIPLLMLMYPERENVTRTRATKTTLEM